MKKNSVDVSFHIRQDEYIKSRAKVGMHIWGRGTGKTTAIGAKHYERFKCMPQAKFFLTSSTYKQILNNCIPAMEDIWKRLGLVEYDFKERSGHYVIGRKPPDHFDKPFKPPRQFEHIITFYNGYTIEMMSMDRPSPHRSANFDGGDADEVMSIKRDYLMKNLLPTIRGNVDRFGIKHPYLHQFAGFGTMPWDAEGQWVLEFEQMAKEKPKEIQYTEATPHYNLDILGPNYIEDQRRLLSPYVFDLEIMNLRLKRAAILFYHKFNEARHTYQPLITYRDGTHSGIMVDKYSDYNQDQLIDISWDFGGWFTCALLFQAGHNRKDSHHVTERMIDSAYVMMGGSAEDVVDQIVDRYKSHRMKFVRIWGDPRGNDKSAWGRPLYDAVRDRFMANGWQVEVCVFATRTHSHDARFKYVNEVLEEKQYHLPRIRCNKETCKAPILSIQFAGATHDGTKDKSMERNKSADQRHAPHFSDAMDYFLMQKYYDRSFSGGMSAGTA